MKPGLTVLFYVPLVLTLDLPEIGTIGVGTKFANPAKFLHFYPSYTYTTIYLTTFKRETTYSAHLDINYLRIIIFILALCHNFKYETFHIKHLCQQVYRI